MFPIRTFKGFFAKSSDAGELEAINSVFKALLGHLPEAGLIDSGNPKHPSIQDLLQAFFNQTNLRKIKAVDIHTARDILSDIIRAAANTQTFQEQIAIIEVDQDAVNTKRAAFESAKKVTENKEKTIQALQLKTQQLTRQKRALDERLTKISPLVPTLPATQKELANTTQALQAVTEALTQIQNKQFAEEQALVALTAAEDSAKAELDQAAKALKTKTALEKRVQAMPTWAQTATTLKPIVEQLNAEHRRTLNASEKIYTEFSTTAIVSEMEMAVTHPNATPQNQADERHRKQQTKYETATKGKIKIRGGAIGRNVEIEKRGNVYIIPPGNIQAAEAGHTGLRLEGATEISAKGGSKKQCCRILTAGLRSGVPTHSAAHQDDSTVRALGQLNALMAQIIKSTPRDTQDRNEAYLAKIHATMMQDLLDSSKKHLMIFCKTLQKTPTIATNAFLTFLALINPQDATSAEPILTLLLSMDSDMRHAFVKGNSDVPYDQNCGNIMIKVHALIGRKIPDKELRIKARKASFWADKNTIKNAKLVGAADFIRNFIDEKRTNGPRQNDWPDAPTPLN